MIHFSYYRNLAFSYWTCAKTVHARFGSLDGGIKVAINLPLNYRNDDMLLLPFPFYYLISHSLELYMKGYLISENFSEKDLNHHDLEKLMRECEDKNFMLKEEEKKYIKNYNKFNHGYAKSGYITRYPFAGTFTLPNCTNYELLEKFDSVLCGKIG